MTRGTSSLLLLLLLAVNSHASQESLANLFESSVDPCDDLARHVCVDKQEMKVAVWKKNFGLFLDVVKVLGGRRQDGFDRIVEAAEKEANTTEEQKKFCRHKNINIDETDFEDDSKKFKIGKAYGEMIAYGRFVEGLQGRKDIRVFRRIRDGSMLYGVVCTADSVKNLITVDSMDKVENEFVKGIFQGFYGKFPELNFDKDSAHKIFLYQNLNVSDFKETIMGKTYWEQQEASWIKNGYKKSIIKYLDSNKIAIGIDKKYRKLAVLKEMMDVYDQEFSKVDQWEQCELEMLSRAHGIARHRLLFTNRSLTPSLSAFQFERSIAESNAFHIGDNIHILPGFLHTLNNYKLSTGFKYGYVAWVIGHEIFHGLGITKKRASELAHLRGVMQEKAYMDAEQSYLKFYGEKQFCMDDGPCPKSSFKIDEGFSDLEATRIVFPILQEALKGRASRKRRGAKDSVELPLFDWRPPGVSEEDVLMSASTADYSEEGWFFLGQQFFTCQIMNRTQEEHVVKNDVHPRSQIRINAIAQQMKAFTKAFGCKKGQRNFLTKNQCALYSPKDYWTEEDDRGAAAALTTMLVFICLSYTCLFWV
uniref:Peptidase_M13 domain-containing protein n=1 Tax=Steinernema glaseri TaxID=37863 RepID=A0A1I8ACE5_9BILA